jgi:hypothetical protein
VTQFVETLSNSPHVHLLLNHAPTVGYGVALVLFLAGQTRRNDDLRRTGLALFFCVAVVSIASYLSGTAAALVLRGGGPEPAYPRFVGARAVRTHEDAATLAFIFMEVTGFVAWLALWHWRRVSRLHPAFFNTVLVLSMVTFGLMARAAELGGAIHHPEITSVAAADPAHAARADAAERQDDAAGSSAADDETPDTEGDEGWTTKFAANVVTGQTWMWPTLETVHFIGLSMLFTVVIVVDLRVLGMIRSVSYAGVYELLPIGLLGFGLNLITGMMFFVGEPEQYVHNPVFFWKVVFILLGGFNVVYFLLDENVWAVKAGDDAPISAKIAAGSSILIWVAVLFCGHMLPFLGNAF